MMTSRLGWTELEDKQTGLLKEGWGVMAIRMQGGGDRLQMTVMTASQLNQLTAGCMRAHINHNSHIMSYTAVSKENQNPLCSLIMTCSQMQLYQKATNVIGQRIIHKSHLIIRITPVFPSLSTKII
jgi:hypothetical protein